MNIHESAEDYLETILMLREEKGYARSVDIAAHLGVTKPSVSFAMKKLRENGYIEMDGNSLITLTEKGAAIAERILDRHRTLTAYICSMGVDPVTAREDACKMEHDISEETYRIIREKVQAMGSRMAESCPAHQDGSCAGDCLVAHGNGGAG